MPSGLAARLRHREASGNGLLQPFVPAAPLLLAVIKISRNSRRDWNSHRWAVAIDANVLAQ